MLSFLTHHAVFLFSGKQGSFFHYSVQQFQTYLAWRGFCTFTYLLVADQLPFAKMCAFACTAYL